ncbi:DUF4241 domain-containing protein [Solicola gregarius]|uniref:DUF4241 domain-containing protein n=1 Tax=Solicola gregarius TaxID=2908642 RepID=A0AA46TFL7_9ACTN|nr:DUF4241 domain-containing protein [Solicola gregarius]UYM04434.1 DUF4241 domain-containing protein [Solicola gregarius]
MTERSEHPRLARQVGARQGAAYNYEGERVMLRRDLVGAVDLPSGELLVCDAGDSTDDSVSVRVSPGSYRVYVTSFRGEYAEVHEPITATLAVRLRETGGISFDPLGRHAITPPVEDPDDPEDDQLHFVGVDSGLVCAVDRAAWSTGAGVSHGPISIAEQVALPDGSRAVVSSSGLGGGGYPVFGGFDLHGDLAVVYVSFDLVFEGERDPSMGAEDGVPTARY